MDDNLYQPPGTTNSGGLSSGRFGRFNLSRAFTLGWDGFQRNMGMAIAALIVLSLCAVAAIFVPPVLGYFLFFPHLVLLGAPLAGLYAVRDRLEISHAFLGFSKFAPIFIGGLIYLLVLIILTAIFSGPSYYYMFKDVDWNAGADAIAQAFTAGSQQIPVWMTLFSYLGSIGGWYVGARLMIFLPLIIERNMAVGEALSASLEATARDQGMLMLFVLLSNIIAGAGVIICGIGVLFSGALSMCLQGAAVYMLLGEDKKEKDSQSDAGSLESGQGDFA